MKKALTTVLVLALAAGLAAFYFMYYAKGYMLPAGEQWRRFGRIEPARGRLLAKAMADAVGNAGGQAAKDGGVAAFIEFLALEGNLGRAELLSRIYRVRPAVLDDALSALKDLDAGGGNGETPSNMKRDPRLMKYVGYPLYGCFRFAQGVRFAQLGDWKTCEREMAAIKSRKSGIRIHPLLLDWVDYYYAKSLLETGDIAGAEEGLKRLERGEIDDSLKAKVMSAEVECEIGRGGDPAHSITLEDFEAEFGPCVELSQAERACGDFYLSKGEDKKAVMRYLSAIEDDPDMGMEAARSLPGLIKGIGIQYDKREQFSSTDRIPEHTRADGVLHRVDHPYLDAAGAAAGWGYGNDLNAALVKLLEITDEPEEKAEIKLGIIALELAGGDAGKAEEYCTQIKPSGGKGDLNAQAEFLLAEYYRRKGDYAKAHAHYLQAQPSHDEICAWAAWQDYLLFKANKTGNVYNAGDALVALERLMARYPASEWYADAAEEALPLYFFAGDNGSVEKICESLRSKSGVKSAATIADYWRFRLAEAKGDGDGARKYRQTLSESGYSYYALSAGFVTDKAGGSKRLLEENESTGEIFFGLGLLESGRDFLESSRWRPFDKEPDSVEAEISLGEEAVAESNFSALPHSAWVAERLLENGRVTSPEIERVILSIAYPMPYEDEVKSAASEFGVPAALIWAIMKKESGFKPGSVSSAGALGLMQLMPDTAAWLAGGNPSLGGGGSTLAPEKNIRLGAAYVAYLMRGRLRGCPIEEIVCGYNAGPGNALTWRARYPSAPGWLFIELIPNQENEVFTKKVLKYYEMYKSLSGE